jgi:triacylglycerol lipase
MSMYDATLSKLLLQACDLTYTQYNNGAPPGNDGKITPPTGYAQIASFTAPEINWQKFSLLGLPSQPGALNTLTPLVSKDIQGSAEVRERVRASFPGIQNVYFGFALTSSSYNIIALRGTQTEFEWVLDATLPQVPVPLGWFKGGEFELAFVHLGFLSVFAMLADQILEAAGQFNPNVPCLVTGHSLGGALAVLASPTLLFQSGLRLQIQMYNFASPRVGNKAFVNAYNLLVPESYRVVNLADMVPMLPPSQTFLWEYDHVGEELSFLNQSGNIAGNHSLIGPHNYQHAVDLEIPTNAKRVYPVTGLGNHSAHAKAHVQVVR